MKREDRNKVKTGTEILNPEKLNQSADNHERHISGSINVRGEIETKRPPDLVKEHATERKEDAAHAKKKFVVECVTAFLILVYTGLTLCSLSVTRTAIRVDKRAWADVREDMQNPLNFPDNSAVHTPIHISNVGKTPAWKVEVLVEIGVLPKDIIPDFSLDPLHSKTNKTGATGYMFTPAVLMPNAPPVDFDVVAKYNPSKQEVLSTTGPVQLQPQVWTTSLRQDIANGSKYVEVHGRITYDDTFGIHHWLQFCKYTAAESFSFTEAARQCTQWIDADKNQ